jgi:predicted MFS family arabinose efflux permease
MLIVPCTSGILNTGYTIGVAAGAMIAGAIEPHLGWRSLFWLQLPLGLLAAILLFLAVPSYITSNLPDQEPSEGLSMKEKVASIDYVGAFLLVAAIVCLLYGLASPTFDAPTVACILTSLLVLLPAFVYQEAYRHPDPIIPVQVLKSRGVLFSCLATLGYMMARWSVLFYTPVFATAVRGKSPAEAGSLLVPTNFGFAVGNLISGFAHIKRDGSFYLACLVIFTLFPISLGLIAFMSTPTISLYAFWFLLFLNGLCAGAGMNYSLAHIQHLVRRGDRIIAIALFSTFRGFAGTFGATVGGGIFDRALRGALKTHFKGLHPPAGLLRELMGSPRAVQKLGGKFREAAVQGYSDALKALFLAGVGLALVTLVLQACTGTENPDEDTNGSIAVDSENTATEQYGVANGRSTPRASSNSRQRARENSNEEQPLLSSTQR